MSFTGFVALQQALQQWEAVGLRRQRRTVSGASAAQVMVDGRRVVSFNSNDYLGLAADARVTAALCEGARRYGVGAGASHLVSGHSEAHERLEQWLANWFAPFLVEGRVLTLSTGYMANVGVLTALAAVCPNETEIFSDSLNHASIIDGARLARARVTVYAHADPQALEEGLRRSSAKQKVVVTDAVFSMDGDVAPLPQLLALCERWGAWLVVDDAHGFGVLGDCGRGALEHFGLRSQQLIYVGTLGKAAGVSGAFVAAHRLVIDWLVQRARPYVYTTASPPALAHALLTSLQIIASPEGQQRRAQLELLRHQLADLPLRPHWRRPLSLTPIQPVIIGESAEALSVAEHLAANGLWISAIRVPTVPPGTARLRVALSAMHTADDVLRLRDALAQLTVVEDASTEVVEP